LGKRIRRLGKDGDCDERQLPLRKKVFDRFKSEAHGCEELHKHVRFNEQEYKKRGKKCE
jgi:hypothetical protein